MPLLYFKFTFATAAVGLLLMLPGVTCAQQLIKGRILSDSGAVIYAAVWAVEAEKGTKSDENGNFEIALTPGRHTLRISAVGFFTLTKEIHTMHFADNKLLSIKMEEMTAGMDEVVITGTMQESYTALSPVKIEVYTSELFKKNPTPNLFEAVGMINGVQPQLNCAVCNTGDIHINGMEGPYTMITIDGMPIVSGLSTVYGLMGIPMGMIRRVEVAKGPASTLYGSEAMGGLINVITKEAYEAPTATADVYVTSQGEVNTDAAVATRGAKVSMLTGINHFRFNNRQDLNGDGFTDMTQQDRISVFNKWNITRKKGRDAAMALRYVYEDRRGGDLNWTPQYRGRDSIYGESIYTDRIELIGRYRLPTHEKINFQYSLNSHRQDSYYGDMAYLASQKIAFGQLLWERAPGNHRLLAGLPVRYTYYDDNTPGTADAAGVNKPQNTFLPGLFVQDEWEIATGTTLLTGLRYDYNSNHGSIVTPRLALRYAPNPMDVWRINAGTGYRVVNLFTEDHAALSGSREVVITENLNPEQSVNISLHRQRYVNADWGFLSLDGGLFYTYFFNQIIGDFETNDRQIIYANLNGHAVSRGASLNVEVTPEHRWKLMAGATWLQAFRNEEDESGHRTITPIYFAPNISGTYSLSYRFDKIGLSIDYTGRVYGPMFLPRIENDPRPEYSPLFSIQNIQLTKKLPRGLEVYAGVKNLFNFIPQRPLLRTNDPFDKEVQRNEAGQVIATANNPEGLVFDATYNYAPVQGIRAFLGLRWLLY